MNVILYESSSKGGCYEYAQYLFRAFKQKNIKIEMVLPKGSLTELLQEYDGIYNLLANDQKKSRFRIGSKVSFLMRQFYNPIWFIWFLSTQSRSVVIWNDFEQLSAFIWVPLLRIFAGKHTHVIVLHDPDRDNYPPSKVYSRFCMKLIMGSMDLALYHHYLPEKPYYKNNKTEYRSIVHGIFDVHASDLIVKNTITSWKQDGILLSVLGNIRQEKNYLCIIDTLAQLPAQYKLLIAGAAANSSVDVEELKRLANKMGVTDRIYWKNAFLTNAELSACIQASDIILLYYTSQFTSQSGVLNLLAPYRKKYVYTDSSSGLERVSKQFRIGVPCVPNDAKELARIIQFSEKQFDDSIQSWENYLHEADWTKTIELIQQWYKEENCNR